MSDWLLLIALAPLIGFALFIIIVGLLMECEAPKEGDVT